MNIKTHRLLAGLAAGLGATTAMADATVSSGASADEVRAIVAEMLSDAETRSSLLQGGGSAGWDDGFFIESGDGSFRLNVGALVQFRYVANFRDDDGGQDDYDGDFQTRTTRLIFDGHIYDDWFYKIQGNFSESESTSGNADFNLENAYVGYGFEDGGALVVGQMKVPLLREELVNQGHQLLIDRSQVNEYFTGGYTQGVAYKWNSDNFRWTAALTDGANQANSDLNVGPATFGESDFSVTWRGEFLASGNWDQFDDFTSPMGSEGGLMVGLAGHYQTGPGDTAVESDIFAYTLDVSWEGDGWNVFAAGMGRDIDIDGGGDGHDYGVVLHGGLYLTEDTELYARYGHIFLDDDAVPMGSDDDSAEFAFGVNHYIHGHAAKLSVDFVYYLDEATAGIGGGIGGDTEIGRLGDDDDGEIAIRAQMQLMF
jgi:hypothetical protein